MGSFLNCLKNLPHVQFPLTKSRLKMRVLETHARGFQVHCSNPRDQLLGRWYGRGLWQRYN